MRENVQRRIVVQSNVSGRDLRSVVNDIQERVGQNVRLPQGYHIEYGGQFESEAQASSQLLWLSLGVVIAIFFILSAAFGSSRDGLLIMLKLPLALIGGVLGVYLAGGVLSVASIVGFITLFGIATRNGIMLVSHIRHLQEQEGVTDFRTAVIRGATERLVPILMTALVNSPSSRSLRGTPGTRQKSSGRSGSDFLTERSATGRKVPTVCGRRP
jgi:Cu/Ag efflux pump CusA